MRVTISFECSIHPTSDYAGSVNIQTLIDCWIAQHTETELEILNPNVEFGEELDVMAKMIISSEDITIEVKI